MAATCTLVLALAVGLGQRGAERMKAGLLRTAWRPDRSDLVPSLLDASVNSAPWQVARRANAPRRPGEGIALVGVDRVLAFSAAYAGVNTLLYVAAEMLPVGEWVGFLGMLVIAWMVGGAYTNTRAHLQSGATR